MEPFDDLLFLARSSTVQAARWLNLLRFQARPGGVSFTEPLDTYHVMFDPARSDEARFAACCRLLPAVERQTVIEQWKFEESLSGRRPSDPYGQEWRTTVRGAVLESVADLLRAAIAGYGAAGIEGDGGGRSKPIGIGGTGSRCH